jgi:hypothetical protein
LSSRNQGPWARICERSTFTLPITRRSIARVKKVELNRSVFELFDGNKPLVNDRDEKHGLFRGNQYMNPKRHRPLICLLLSIIIVIQVHLLFITWNNCIFRREQNFSRNSSTSFQISAFSHSARPIALGAPILREKILSQFHSKSTNLSFLEQITF